MRRLFVILALVLTACHAVTAPAKSCPKGRTDCDNSNAPRDTVKP